MVAQGYSMRDYDVSYRLIGGAGMVVQVVTALALTCGVVHALQVRGGSLRRARRHGARHGARRHGNSSAALSNQVGQTY